MAETKSILKTFYATKPMPCDYLPDRMESKTAVDLNGPNAQSWANALSRAGFRRSHNVCYIPSCPECGACVSVRICVDRFLPSKKMKKTIRRNEKAAVHFVPNVATAEQYDLFKTYLAARHAGSAMETMFFEEYRAMIEDSPVDSCLLEVRQGEDAHLSGVMLVDVLDDGLSAVYSFFDPACSGQSPGTFMILELIKQTLRLQKPYVYLGYLIRELSNMTYKERFAPLEYCRAGQWSDSFPD